MQGSVRQRNKTWSYTFDLGYVNGKRKRREKGGFKTKKEAERALREAIREYENTGQVFQSCNMTLADYMDLWMKEYVEVNCRFGTIKNYKVIVSNTIKPALGDYKLTALNPALLQQFINEIPKQGYSKSSLNSIFVVLSEALKAAVFPYQYIKENPMQYVKRPKYNTQKKDLSDKIITVDTFNKIIELYPQGTPYYIPFMIGYYTGFRVTEVLGLTWEDVDFTHNTISVNNILSYKENKTHVLGTPKTPTSIRTISVSENLIKILKQHKTYQSENRLKYGNLYANYYLTNENVVTKEYNSEYRPLNFLCTHKDGRLIFYATFYNEIKKIRNKLNIQFTFHNLRHSHATLLIENGANVKDVQQRLGHSNYSTTMDIYSHVTDEMQSKTVKIFDETICRQNK